MSRFNITPVKLDNLHFLIHDCPSDKTLPGYIPIFEQHNTTDLVRLCEGSPYETQPLNSIGIKVHDDMKFDDGTAPNDQIISRWLDLNQEVFFDSPTPNRCIAVHCMSGIGRAPVLVAVSLIENGMDPLDAIAYIRASRRGVLNSVQIAFLNSYKRRTKGFHMKTRKSNNGFKFSVLRRTNGKTEPVALLTPVPSAASIPVNHEDDKKRGSGFFSRIYHKLKS